MSQVCMPILHADFSLMNACAPWRSDCKATPGSLYSPSSVGPWSKGFCVSRKGFCVCRPPQQNG